MSEAPLVSVLTPVYNGAEFLSECIESVLGQTYSNWEYVILDNVSTDETAAIAARYAARDSRIRVVRATEFVNLYTNHNRALELIYPGSRYCKFVHADDWLYPECVERMVELAEDHPTVGVVSSFRLVGTRVEHESPLPYPQHVMSGHELIRWELLGTAPDVTPGWVTGSPTTILLRTTCVQGRKQFFDPEFWHGDTDAAYRVLLDSDFGFIQQVLTYTRSHPGAQTPFSSRVWSFPTRDGRLILRYGPKVLPAAVYRQRIRAWLKEYALWLVKQALRPDRHRQTEFHEFHRRELQFLIEDARDDREARVVLGLCRYLLHRDYSRQ